MSNHIKYAHVVATSDNNAIGSQGDIPWYIPEDLKFFKQVTLNHVMVLGRKTYQSFKRPLPKRIHVVVSRDQQWLEEMRRNLDREHLDRVQSDVVGVTTLEEAFRVAEREAGARSQDVIYIVGGGEIYKQTMSKVDVIYLTKVHQDIPHADAFYPTIPAGEFIEEVVLSAAEPLPYTRYVLNRLEKSY